MSAHAREIRDPWAIQLERSVHNYKYNREPESLIIQRKEQGAFHRARWVHCLGSCSGSGISPNSYGHILASGTWRASIQKKQESQGSKAARKTSYRTIIVQASWNRFLGSDGWWEISRYTTRQGEGREEREMRTRWEGWKDTWIRIKAWSPARKAAAEAGAGDAARQGMEGRCRGPWTCVSVREMDTGPAQYPLHAKESQFLNKDEFIFKIWNAFEISYGPC